MKLAHRLLVPLVACVMAAVAAGCTQDSKPSVPTESTPESAATTVATAPATSQTPTPAAPAGPSTPQPSGSPFDPLNQPGVSVRPMTIGDPVEFPAGTVMIVELGCTQCDGPTSGVQRVYRGADGPVRTDTLIDRAWLTARGAAQNGYILRVFVRNDANELIVGVCLTGACDGPVTPSATRAYFRSQDGGITWQPYAIADDGYFPVELTPDGVVMIHTEEVKVSAADGRGERTDYRYSYRLDSDKPITPPPGASELIAIGRATPNMPGMLWWDRTGKRVLRSDGSAAMTMPAIYADTYGPQVADDGRVVALWRPRPPGSSVTSFYGCYLTVQSGVATQRGVHSAPQCPQPVAWLDQQNLVANLFYDAPPGTNATAASGPFFGSRATLVDPESGVARPIEGAPAERFGRNRVLTVARGGFLRVASTPCLNLREQASTSSPVMLCAAKGVLLRAAPSTPPQTAEGRQWRNVILPDGRFGWAASEELE